METKGKFVLVDKETPFDYNNARVIQNPNECQKAWNQIISSGQIKYGNPETRLTVVKESVDFVPYGCQYSKVKPSSDPSKPETMVLRFNTNTSSRKPCSDWAKCILFGQLE